MSAITPDDPPWLDEAAASGFNESRYPQVWRNAEPAEKIAARTFVRAVLAFAARQPRQITEAKVEVAWKSFPYRVLRDDVRAALEAAEKARNTPPPADDVLGEAHMRRPNSPYLPG